MSSREHTTVALYRTAKQPHGCRSGWTLGAQPRRQQPCWHGVQTNCVLLLIELHVQTQRRAATVPPTSQHRLQALQSRGTSPLSITMHRRTSHQTIIHIPDMPAQGLRAPVYVASTEQEQHREYIYSAAQHGSCRPAWGTQPAPPCAAHSNPCSTGTQQPTPPIEYAACRLLLPQLP